MAKTGRMKLDVGRDILKGKLLTSRQKQIRDNMKTVYKRKDGIMTIEAPGYGASTNWWREDMGTGKSRVKKGEIVEED